MTKHDKVLLFSQFLCPNFVFWTKKNSVWPEKQQIEPRTCILLKFTKLVSPIEPFIRFYINIWMAPLG